MESAGPEKSRGGRTFRYGERAVRLDVYLPPALEALVQEAANGRRVPGGRKWTASQLAAEAIARAYSFDLTSQES
jgi:hypothetical protein